MTRVLAGGVPRDLAGDVTEFGAALLIVDDHRTLGPLSSLGLAGRLARRSRVPVLLLPRPRRPRRSRAAPPLHVVR